MCKKLEDAASSVVFQNELWHVRPIDEPSGVPGWMMLVARRHSGPYFLVRSPRSSAAATTVANYVVRPPAQISALLGARQQSIRLVMEDSAQLRFCQPSSRIGFARCSAPTTFSWT
jgi:hypothetical protein